MLFVESVSTIFTHFRSLKFSGAFFNAIIDLLKCDFLKPKIFAPEYSNLRDLCLWPAIRNLEIFACGIRNLRDLCLWNPESGKSFLAESVILRFWNPYFSSSNYESR